MNPLNNIRRLILALMLVLVAMAQTMAQVTHDVFRGEVYALGVINVPGETYEWKVYKDHTLSVEAGNNEVIFINGNTGSQVPIRWLKTGVYYFTVRAQSAMGCSNLKVGMITVEEEQNLSPTISISTDQNPICKGALVKFTASVMGAGYSPIFTWTKNGIQVGENSPVLYDSTVIDRDVISCTMISRSKEGGTVITKSNDIRMTVLTVIAGFTFTENFSNINGNLLFNNTSKGAETYNWDFGDGQVSNEVNPSVTYTKDGIYMIRLTAMNRINCMDTCSYKYVMLFKGLYIPNAFAPGSASQLGSVFQPAGISLKKYKIEVYDNWGHLMWESSALDSNGTPTESWDGTYEGRPMPQGTYLWKVNAEFLDETIWQGSDNKSGKGKGASFGTVLLIR